MFIVRMLRFTDAKPKLGIYELFCIRDPNDFKFGTVKYETVSTVN